MEEMQKENLIAINDFCINHNIEISFISSLQQTGLLDITNRDETSFIDIDQLPQLEKYIRFYYELDINLEGIETITHLLHRIIAMQDEITALRNRLRFYETNDARTE
jgi:MerR HTH family regulatory protein